MLSEPEAVSAAISAASLYAMASGRGRYQHAAATVYRRNVWRGNYEVEVTLGRTWGHNTTQLLTISFNVTKEGECMVLAESEMLEPQSLSNNN